VAVFQPREILRTLAAHRVEYVSTSIAALEDVIREKEAANREKDRLALPTLRLLLERIREREHPPKNDA